MKILVSFIAWASFLFLMISCSTSGTILNSTTLGKIDKPVDHLLVLGLNYNENNRSLLENELVVRLNQMGYTAVAWRKLALNNKQIPDKEQLINVMSTESFDGVLILKISGLNTSERFKQRENINPNDPYLYNYLNAFKKDFNPGYIQGDHFLEVESNLYLLKNEQLVFSAISETFLQEDIEKTVGDFSKFLVKKLHQSKLLKNAEG